MEIFDSAILDTCYIKEELALEHNGNCTSENSQRATKDVGENSGPCPTTNRPNHGDEQDASEDLKSPNDEDVDITGLYPCEFCGYLFTRSYINLHKLSHRVAKGTKTYKCNVCSKSFGRKSHLVKHENCHRDVKIKPYCPTCGRGFVDPYHLKRHMCTHRNTTEKPFECSECLKRYPDENRLKIHQRLHLTSEDYGCHICGRQFKQRDYLAAHLKRHEAIKKHVCTVCQAGYSVLPDLKRHMRKHTGEKPYECVQCGKHFKRSDALKVHLLTHKDSSAEPFTCCICDKQFKQAGYLKVHMRIHTGKKPFRCRECKRQFTLAVNLKSHALKVHGNIFFDDETEAIPLDFQPETRL